MIWDWTDSIFKWKGWGVIKWIFGAFCAIGIILVIINLGRINKYLESNIPLKILKNF